MMLYISQLSSTHTALVELSYRSDEEPTSKIEEFQKTLKEPSKKTYTTIWPSKKKQTFTVPRTHRHVTLTGGEVPVEKLTF